MIDAVGGAETVVFYRPVDRAAAVGPEATTQKREAGVVDREGKPLSRDAAASEMALSQEKRSLLARLRGEKDALEQELLRAPSSDDPFLSNSNSSDAGLPATEETALPPGTASENAEGESAALNDLSEAEEAQVAELKARDREVRAHEQAHVMVGGQYAGAPTYEYQTGPDGRRYAVGGSVSIDVSPVPGDPEATIEKMRTVAAAALAPAEPSGQDRSVARAAQAAMREAMSEARSENAAELRGKDPEQESGAALSIETALAAAAYAEAQAAMGTGGAPAYQFAA